MGGLCRQADEADNMQSLSKFYDNQIAVEGNMLNPRVRSIITVLKKAKLDYRDDEQMGILSLVEVDPTVIV